MTSDPANTEMLDSPAKLPGDPCAVKQSREPSIIRHSRRQAIAEVLLILCLFFVYAGWPAPDVNESHYLCKVKQAWNPDWLPGDFFLNTPDAHPLFTATFGWMTRFLSLPVFAWTGRVLTWLALAWAWRRLSDALVSREWYPVLSALLFVYACEISAPAGEWVIGGFEAKGPAYVFVLLALERVIRNRWNQALLLLGAASAFHVLVGGWATVAVAFAWLLAGQGRPALRTISRGLVGGFVLSLAGLVPAMSLSSGAGDAALHEANRVYVFWRLPHHLDPASWGAEKTVAKAICLGVLLLLGIISFLAFRRFSPYRRLAGVVMGATLLGVIGCAIGFGLRSHPLLAAALLRFYWFRLTDVLVPLGFAMGVMTAVSYWRYHWLTKCLLVCLLAVIVVRIGTMTLERRGAPPRADKEIVAYLDWRDMCRVAKETTPRKARFLTPRMAQTFHWYAERADVVNWKDIPQDTPSIVWWAESIRDIYLLDDGPEVPLCDQETDDVRHLAAAYDAGYVITFADPPLDLPRIYSNRTYALYRVPPQPGPKPVEGEEPAQEEPDGDEK